MGSTNEPELGKGLAWAGVAGTAVWLVLALVYVVISREKLLALNPNEVGDFVAGCFAPLAFFWLVLGFFQQGSELRNSGRALWLQGEELRNSVEQQRQLVDVTREQLQFESQRISAEIERQRRLAQPRLSLEVADWGGNLGRTQNFHLVNYGRPCTQIEIGFTNEWSNEKTSHLGTGERFKFQQWMVPELPPVTASIAYLDEQMEPGVARYEIRYDDADVTVWELPEPPVS